MKKQQETMKLYNKAGVNPMAGCVVYANAVFYALFQFSLQQWIKGRKVFFGQMICLLTILFTSYHSIFRFTEITLVVSDFGIDCDLLLYENDW
jgi:membrane protein insertase Oxa1/YidC/SpoIIIJ